MSLAGRLILAYHGCDARTEQALIAHKTQLLLSDNPYDWLGKGANFFEDDAARAFHFAQTVASQPERRLTRRPITQPAVVGAVLRISYWLDLTTQEGVDEFAAAFAALQLSMGPNRAMPVNHAAGDDDSELILHNLDRAVIGVLHVGRENEGLGPYQAVRGAFMQGEPIGPTSAIRRRSRVQLALRDLACVVGHFHAHRRV